MPRSRPVPRHDCKRGARAVTLPTERLHRRDQLSDFYRFLPIFTDFYRFLPIFRTFLQVYYQVCYSPGSLPAVLFTS